MDLISLLAKKVAEPNVAVALVAINIIEKMAIGLKASFSQHREVLFMPLLDRMKEKKVHIIEALRLALDAFIASFSSIIEVMGDILIGLAHLNPTVRIESLHLVSRFLIFGGSIPKSEMRAMAEKLIKVISLMLITRLWMIMFLK